MQAILSGFSATTQAARRRAPGQVAARTVSGHDAAGYIAHVLGGPATVILGNLQLASQALEAGRSQEAAELLSDALAAANGLQRDMSGIRGVFGLDRLEPTRRYPHSLQACNTANTTIPAA